MKNNISRQRLPDVSKADKKEIDSDKFIGLFENTPFNPDSNIFNIYMNIKELILLSEQDKFEDAVKNIDGHIEMITLIKRAGAISIGSAMLTEYNKSDTNSTSEFFYEKNAQLELFLKQVNEEMNEIKGELHESGTAFINAMRHGDNNDHNEKREKGGDAEKSYDDIKIYNTGPQNADVEDENSKRISLLRDIIAENQKHLNHLVGFLNEADGVKSKSNTLITGWEQSIKHIKNTYKQLKETKENLESAEKKADDMKNKALALENALNDMIDTNDEDAKRAEKIVSELYEEITRLKEESANVIRERTTLEAELLNHELAKAEGDSKGKDFKIGEMKQKISELEEEIIGVRTERVTLEAELLNHELAKAEGDSKGKDFKIAEIKAELENTRNMLEDANNSIDHTRRISLSSVPPAPDSANGILVTENQKLKKEVEDLNKKLIEVEIDNSNPSFKIELLESEVKRLKEHIEESKKLPSPDINAIRSAVIEKEEAETKVDELKREIKKLKEELKDKKNEVEDGEIILSVEDILSEESDRPHVPPPVKKIRKSNPPKFNIPKPGSVPPSQKKPSDPPPPIPKPSPVISEPKVVLSEDYITDVKKAEERASIGGQIRWFFDRLFSYGMKRR